MQARLLTFRFGVQPQKLDSVCAYLKGALHKHRLSEGGEGDDQLLVLHIQLGKSIEELRGVGSEVVNVYFPPERPRQRWNRPLVRFRCEPTELKGSDIGKIIDQGYERTERCDGVPEGEVCEGFTERRETDTKFFFVDVLDPDIG